MSNPIKQWIFEYQLNRCHKKYEKQLDILSDPYSQWITETESDSVPGIHMPEITLSDFAMHIRNQTDGMPDTWFCVSLSEGSVTLPPADCNEVFDVKSQAALVYADEDMVASDSKKRYGAWMKPDESPDTLLSFFYFGSLIFLCGMYLEDYLKSDFAPSKEELSLLTTDRMLLYDFILRFTEYMKEHSLEIVHLPKVLFHGIGDAWQPEDPKKPEVVCERAYWGYEPEYDLIKQNAVKRRGYRMSAKHFDFAGKTYSVPVYEAGTGEKTTKPLVSVIIPSKDNVEVLSVCLRSLKEKTLYTEYEIIIVDNGSTAENQKKIIDMKAEFGFVYIYKPMDFNFSAMCNMGAARAKGSYILLLNDDMEIIQPDWMDILVGQAACSHVGAVGAKLLYPDSNKIQHAGITNLWVGPAHKLLKEADDKDYYYGRNVLPYDMVGVTAACLLVSKEKYQEAGGFCEDIAISYNDVDFCFSLHELGYYNVIRNDVCLYHHESVSRGDDRLSEEKWDRLLHEKDICYDRHPALKGKDPFYNPHLAGFKHKYFCSHLYPYEQRLSFNSVSVFNEVIREEWHNNCLTVTLEHVRLERKLDLKDEKDVYWMEGWSYVLGMDNSRYKKTVLLTKEDGTVLSFTPFDRYRPDVVEILPEQVNVAISGFSCRIKREDLEPGRYKVSLLYKDCCSRQRLYKECEEPLVVE